MFLTRTLWLYNQEKLCYRLDYRAMFQLTQISFHYLQKYHFSRQMSMCISDWLWGRTGWAVCRRLTSWLHYPLQVYWRNCFKWWSVGASLWTKWSILGTNAKLYRYAFPYLFHFTYCSWKVRFCIPVDFLYCSMFLPCQASPNYVTVFHCSVI